MAACAAFAVTGLKPAKPKNTASVIAAAAIFFTVLIARFIRLPPVCCLMQCDLGYCNSFATLSYHIRNSYVTRVSQSHTDVKRFRGWFAEKIQIFKKSSPFYRNSSVTKRSKMLQLCCASCQNKPSATASAHFLGHFGAFRFVYYCIYMHHFAYRGFCVRFCGASLCSLLRSFPREQIGAAVQYPAQQLLYKKHKKEAAAQKMCNGLSQFRLCY